MVSEEAGKRPREEREEGLKRIKKSLKSLSKESENPDASNEEPGKEAEVGGSGEETAMGLSCRLGRVSKPLQRASCYCNTEELHPAHHCFCKC